MAQVEAATEPAGEEGEEVIPRRLLYFWCWLRGWHTCRCVREPGKSTYAAWCRTCGVRCIGGLEKQRG